MFGMSSASEAFQRVMYQEVVKDLKGAVGFVDDLLVSGKDVWDHDKNLAMLLRRLRECNLSLNEAKCQIRQRTVEFMGYKISAAGIEPTAQESI